MIVPPVALGNADPDWPPPPRGINGPGVAQMQIGPPIALVEVEAYPNPAPRKCIWAMLLLSSLLVLRVQQDRYAEVVRWHGGIPDNSGPFPWEIQPLVSRNDSFQATFLAPIMRRASTFIQPPHAEESMVVTGLSRTMSLGGSSGVTGVASQYGNAAGEALPAGVSAVVVGGTATTLPAACPKGNATSPCYVGVQTLASQQAERALPRPPAGDVVCHQFIAGGTLATMRPLLPAAPGVAPTAGAATATSAGSPAAAYGVGCVRGEHIHAAVVSSVNDTVVVAWDPPSSRSRLRGNSGRPVSCLASVSLSSMRPGPVVHVEWASTVLFDQRSSSIITVGFSGAQTLVAQQLDAATLQPRWRYRLPLSVAWLLHTPRVSDGFLIFVGSEQPFVGTIFVVDLRSSEIYEQDPPPTASGRRQPRRRRLPRAMFVESLVGNQAGLSAGHDASRTGELVEGPCSIFNPLAELAAAAAPPAASSTSAADKVGVAGGSSHDGGDVKSPDR